ncbi:MAG: putative dsRNA-binding protein, partial [Pseudomonas sp.]
KTALQELLQGKRMKLPHYEVLDISGVAHKQIFTVGCTVTEWNISAQGTGSSRRAGEQAAAAAVLEQLKVKKS